jgi:superfamily II DNA/RNA helicase
MPPNGHCPGLVVVPTRELAQQVYKEILHFYHRTGKGANTEFRWDLVITLT